MMAKPDGKYSCGCGRSPTGNCCGWHALTEEAYQQKRAEYEEAQLQIKRQDELEAYRQQAMELWFDNGGSCTGDRKSSA